MQNQIIATGDAIWAGVVSGFTSFMNFLPAIIGAILVLIVGWIVSAFIARLVEKGLRLLKLDEGVRRTGFVDNVQALHGGEAPVSHLLAVLAKWFIRLIFIQAAANLLHMPQVTAIINSILLFLPNLFVAIAILVAGTMLARFLGDIVAASVANIPRAKIFPLVTRYGVIGFAVIAAINQIGIATNLINILVTGLVFSIALAVGLAFGLGGQSVASEVTRSWYQEGKDNATKLRSVAGEKK